jgi:hypothetical protein
MRLPTKFQFATMLAAVYLCSPDAQAYLDPGTGSLIVQLLLGAIFGAVMTVKLWWAQARSVIGNLFRRGGGDPE